MPIDIAIVRRDTERFMQCACGGTVAITTNLRLVCMKCNVQVSLDGCHHSESTIRQAWPDRAIAHDKSFRSRMKEFGDAAKRLEELYD